MNVYVKNSTSFLVDLKNAVNTTLFVERDSIFTNGERTVNVSIPMKSMTQIISAANEDATVSKAISGALGEKLAGLTMTLLLKQKANGNLEDVQSVLTIFQWLITKSCNMRL
jgi:hypothetical protein